MYVHVSTHGQKSVCVYMYIFTRIHTYSPCRTLLLPTPADQKVSCRLLSAQDGQEQGRLGEPSSGERGPKESVKTDPKIVLTVLLFTSNMSQNDVGGYSDVCTNENLAFEIFTSVGSLGRRARDLRICRSSLTLTRHPSDSFGGRQKPLPQVFFQGSCDSRSRTSQNPPLTSFSLSQPHEAFRGAYQKAGYGGWSLNAWILCLASDG